jgi:gamma-glutamyltranspeptidase/glutathione hydrolase
MAAALNVTQPCSTGTLFSIFYLKLFFCSSLGIGGDAFVLYWDAKQRRVRGLNGSGRAPQGLSLARLNAEGFGCGEGLRELPPFHVHTVRLSLSLSLSGLSYSQIIVPGAAAAWCDTVSRFGSGRLTLPEILAPAIELAEGGFPVAPVTADWWASSRSKLLEHPNGRDMLMPNGEPPKAGDIMRMPNLARTFRELAQKGAAGFYSGRVGKAIVELVQRCSGLFALLECFFFFFFSFVTTIV